MGAQVVLLLLLQVLLILFSVVFDADLRVGAHANLDVALVAANVLQLQLERSFMVFRINLDSVGAHDAELD